MNTKWDFEPKDFGKRLESVRGNRSQEAFAKGMGVHKNTLRMYEQGERQPDAKLLALVCQQEDILPEWLLFGTPPMTNRERQELERMRASYVTADALEDEFVLVPRYESPYLVKDGKLGVEEKVETQVAFRRSWVVGDMHLNPDKLAAILVIGDAMEPTLRNHDIILLDMTQNDVLQDALYAMNFDGKLMVKRLQLLPDGGLLIHSDEAKYSQITIDKAQREAQPILGRVVWMGRRL